MVWISYLIKFNIYFVKKNDIYYLYLQKLSQYKTICFKALSFLCDCSLSYHRLYEQFA